MVSCSPSKQNKAAPALMMISIVSYLHFFSQLLLFFSSCCSEAIEHYWSRSLKNRENSSSSSRKSQRTYWLKRVWRGKWWVQGSFLLRSSGGGAAKDTPSSIKHARKQQKPACGPVQETKTKRSGRERKQVKSPNKNPETKDDRQRKETCVTHESGCRILWELIGEALWRLWQNMDHAWVEDWSRSRSTLINMQRYCSSFMHSKQEAVFGGWRPTREVEKKQNKAFCDPGYKCFMLTFPQFVCFLVGTKNTMPCVALNRVLYRWPTAAEDPVPVVCVSIAAFSHNTYIVQL